MTPRIRHVRAPAKINLGLRLMGIRDDGYHTLESLFAPIGVFDDLEIAIESGEPGIELVIERTNSADSGALPTQMSEALSTIPSGPDNLVVRAAAAVCKETGFNGRVRLSLTKRIPAGAGLGGGSSDAAAVLVGLASLLGAELSNDRLHSLALGLGADVPFFLAPTPAFVSGIGERIEPIEGIPRLDLVVVNPGVGLATAEVFRATDALRSALTDGRPGSTMRAILGLRGETGDLGPALGDLLVNDLEPAARRLCPPVSRLIERLREVGAIGASMSGSGATVFGVFASGEIARHAAQALRGSEANDCWIQVTEIITAEGRKDETLGA